MLTLGIPKETKPREKRVALVPGAVAQLKGQGVPVCVQSGAGSESGYSDAAYQAAGAQIVKSGEELYSKAQLIQKVKEPQPGEYPFLRSSHWLFCFLHLASPANCELVRTLCRTGLHAIGYETVEKDQRLPLLGPMSDIAGGLAALYGGYLVRMGFLNQPFETHPYPADFRAALESLAKHFPQCPDDYALGEVVIFGAGKAGMRAHQLCSQMKGSVTLVERNETKRASLKEAGILTITPDQLTDEKLSRAEMMIGCAHTPGKRAAQVLDARRLERISREKKKVMMDVSIDQGGNFPDAQSTTYEDPLHHDRFGNLRFSVANLPSFCGPKASEALSEASLPYTGALAQDPETALRDFPELRKGLNIARGKILIPAVSAAHKTP